MSCFSESGSTFQYGKKKSIVLRNVFGQCSGRIPFFLNPSTLILDCSESSMTGFFIEELLYFTQQKAMFAPQLLLSSNSCGSLSVEKTHSPNNFLIFPNNFLFWLFFSFDNLVGKNKQNVEKTFHSALSHVASFPSDLNLFISSVQFAQLCLTLCDPMNRSTPGLPLHHQLPEFT